MSNLTLFIKYAWRSIARGGQRTFFAVLCIAVGVASIVALQSTGSTIQDAVAGDARANSQADVLVGSREDTFSSQDLAKLDKLKQAGTLVDYTTMVNFTAITVLHTDGSKTNDFGSNYPSFVIDPAKYPFYGKVELASPAGKTLKEVLTGPNQIVIDDKMAKSLGAKVGDQVTAISDLKRQPVTVVGILTGKSLTPASDTGQASFTGYNYMSQETARGIFPPEVLLPQTVYVKTSDAKGADVQARDAINNLSPVYVAQTSTERNDQLKQASKGISTLLGYVGLLSLLIGSVGVVNTMLVVVGRRSTEIATIKTLGMEGGQTVQIFVIEAAILGVLGSLAGVILGEGLTLIINKAAEGFINTTLDYKFYWQPILIGIVVGIVTAVVFGLLPAYSASKIPPAQVLRQKTNSLPRISFWATLLIIVIMTVVMGTLSGIVLDGKFTLGITLAFGTLIGCAILVMLFSGLLWLVGKIPLPFGLNYKMARRNLSRSRVKSATTMLVMLVGIFAMALVFILSSSLKTTIQDALERGFGYNLDVSSVNPTQTAAIQQALDSGKVPGLQKYLVDTAAQPRVVSARGLTTEQLIAEKVQRDKAKGKNRTDAVGSGYQITGLYGVTPAGLLSLAKLTSGQVYQNDNQMAISQQIADDYQLKVGDQIVYQDVNGQQYTLTITGIFESKSFVVDVPLATTLTRVQSLPNHKTDFNLTIDKNRVDEASKYFQTNFASATVTDLSFISNVINSIINNITAFPVLLAFLALIAGAVLIANNVALAVLERRTEMGVMKSIGADNMRVLSIINWESGIVGFLGGLFGLMLAVSVAAFGVAQLGTQDDPGVLDVSPLISLGMIILGIGLAIAATTASAWSAAQEKPLVVLRYE